MKHKGYNYILLTLSFVVMGILVWAYKNQKEFLVTPEKQVPTRRVYSEKELVDRLEKVFMFLSPKAEEQLLRGKINVKEVGSNNGADEEPINYTFSKRGTEFYYHMGEVEYFNNKKIAVAIDHGQRQIKVLKTINPSKLYMPMMSLDQLPELIKSEGYKLASTENGSIQTITLKNEYHFTCREYALTFDTLSCVPKHIFARFTGAANTGQVEGEKHLSIELEKVDRLSDIESYLGKMPLIQRGGKWKVIPKYENYYMLGL